MKVHLPYHESDHVLNTAYNLLAGGTCLEQLEMLRNDEVYLDALDARRIPDPSEEGAHKYFDRSIALCRRAGFKNITLRGDTAFTQTEYLDGWDDDGVRFIFGIDAMANLYELAENLPQTAWKTLYRKPKHEVKTEPRRRPKNVKEEIVRRREFTNIRLTKEHVAEFAYSPTKCKHTYRVVALWKDLEVSQGQRKLFDDAKCFFCITNDWKTPADEIVFTANGGSSIACWPGIRGSMSSSASWIN